MRIFQGRCLQAAVAAALALMGCTTLEPRATASRPNGRLTIEPVLAVRHGMSVEQTYRTARALQDQGRLDEAVAAFRQVLLSDPLHADAHNGLGVIHSLRGEAARAESEFRLAITLAPQAAYLKDNLALHLSRQAQAQAQVKQPMPPAASTPPVAPAGPAAEPAPARPLDPPRPLVALAPMPAPTLAPTARLERVAESVWQLRNGAFLQEVPVTPAAVPGPLAAASPEPVKVAANAPIPVIARSAAPMARYRIEVSNGNGTTGLARRTSQLLPQESLAGIRLTNQKPFGVAGSVIQHVPGAEAAANQVRVSLPVEVPLARVDRLERDAAVRLLLGRDFPPDAPAVASVRLAAR